MDIDDLMKPGKLGGADVCNVSAVRGGDGYLFVYPDVTFLLDTGFGFAAAEMYDNIVRILGERKLDYILLTHSHYDHCLGSAYLKKMYPQVKVIAYTHAAEVMKKESARKVMLRLDQAAAQFFGYPYTFADIELLAADITVEDGDHIRLGKHEAEVLSLPGHTRDSIGFYFAESRMMLGCETIGIYVSDGLVMPNFLVGYEMTLQSIRRLSGYAMDSYLVPHEGVLRGEQVTKFLQDAYRCHEEGKDLIVTAYREGRSTEDIIRLYQEKFFTDEVRKVYPPAAFAENIHIQIPMILQECGMMKV